MGYPDSLADFRALVAAMRETGVTKAFGVELGPEPKPPAAEVKPPTPEERRLARIEQARDELRLTLAHTGQTFTDAQLDAMLDPAVLA